MGTERRSHYPWYRRQRGAALPCDFCTAQTPSRLLHGERDTVTNPESFQKLNDALIEAGHDSRVILFDGRHIVPPQLTAEIVLELASE